MKHEGPDQILQRLADQSLQLKIRHGRLSGTATILKVDNEEIVLGPLDPPKLNNQLERGDRINVEVSEVYHVAVLNHKFKLRFIAPESLNGKLVNKFELPASIKTRKAPYTIYPTRMDNVTVSFKIGGTGLFKKVKSITLEEIRFEQMLELYKKYNGQMIYDIELKLPFKRLKIAAKLKHLKHEFFAFTDYISGKETNDAVSQYAEEDYRERNRLTSSNRGKTVARAKRDTEVETKEKSGSVFVVTNDRYTADTITQTLSRTDFRVAFFTDTKNALESILESCPDIVLMDDATCLEDGSDFVANIRKHPAMKHAPIIRITSGSSTSDSGAGGMCDGVINKPVQGEALQEIIEQRGREALHQKSLRSDSVFLCVDDPDYSDTLYTRLTGDGFEVQAFSNPSAMFLRMPDTGVGMVIVRLFSQRQPLMEIVGRIRDRQEFARTKLLVVPPNQLDGELLEALNDQALTTAAPDMDPVQLAQQVIDGEV